MDLMAIIEDNIAVVWLTVGILLLAGEMVVPGVYLMWLGGAAVLTSSAVYFLGDMGHVGNVLCFVTISVVSVIFANRTIYAKAQALGQGRVNLRGGQHIGQVYEVVEAIKNGRGRVKVADSNWSAQGPDCPAGSLVEVVEVDGSMMRVELAKDP